MISGWQRRKPDTIEPTGEPKIEIDALVRIAGLFRFRWDPPILAVLAERSFRFRALLTRLESHIGEHVDDNALTRSLRRLTRSGLVRADNKRVGRRNIKVYSVTDTGREHVELYHAFITVYEHRRKPAGACDRTCCVHGPQRTQAFP